MGGTLAKAPWPHTRAFQTRMRAHARAAESEGSMCQHTFSFAVFMFRFVFWLKKSEALGSFSRPARRSRFCCRQYEIIKGAGLNSRWQNWPHFVNEGTGCFLFFHGAFRPSCGASGRASVRSLGFLEPPRGSAVWAVNGTMRLPGRGGWVSWCGLGSFPGMWVSQKWSSCQDQGAALI